MARKRLTASASLAALLVGLAPAALCAPLPEESSGSIMDPAEAPGRRSGGIFSAQDPAPAPIPGGKSPSNLSGYGRDDSDFSKLLGQSLAAVLVVLALGAVGILLVKKVLPRVGAGQGRRISVIETVYVGPRKSLHLVQIGDRTLLLAGTRERLSMLTDLTGSVLPEGRSLPSSGRPRARFVLPGGPDAAAETEDEP